MPRLPSHSNRRSALRSLIPVAGIALLVGGCMDSTEASEETSDTEQHDVQVDIVASGLDSPWGMEFLPGDPVNRLLVTELSGRLNLVDLDTGEVTEISGVPDVVAMGQGGLLDVTVHPEFTSPGNAWVYLTYAAAEDGNAGAYATHTARGRFNEADMTLEDVEVLHIATPFSGSTAHYGSRLQFHEGYLFITQGDRRDSDSAQGLQSHWGSTLRLEPDGSIPGDNPFVNDSDTLDAIYTYGHRNSQGMAVQPETGLLWQNEHGEQNGDEINIIDQAGANYGWPIATYGTDYSTDEPIGVLPSEDPDTIDPVYFWTGDEYEDGQQGFPPSGMVFYQGDAFPQWQGHIFMGNLQHQYLGRFEVDGREVIAEHRMLRNRGWRVRDVTVHPDSGEIYLIVDDPDAPLVRLSPESD